MTQALWSGEDDDPNVWDLVSGSTGFVPSQISSVKRWYRLAASTPVSSEYETVTEVLGGTAITQTDADRKPAAATSANSLPVATFDGTDVWLQTLESGNNSTGKWWTLFWIKPADLGALQRIYAAMSAGLSGSASANRLRLAINGGTGFLSIDIFVSGANGRNYLATVSGVSAGAWRSVYVQFDPTRTDEVDTDGADEDCKVRAALGTTFIALGGSDIGTGGAVTGLVAATGSATLGASSDSDTPASPLRNGGQFGPNWFFGDEPLTGAELLALTSFEVPT